MSRTIFYGSYLTLLSIAVEGGGGRGEGGGGRGEGGGGGIKVVSAILYLRTAPI